MRGNIEILNLPQHKEESNFLVLEPNNHSTTFFTNYLLAIESQILLNKPVDLGLPVVELSILLMYQFQYGYIRAKYGKKANIFIKTLQKMLNLDLILQIMNQIDHYLKEKIEK